MIDKVLIQKWAETHPIESQRFRPWMRFTGDFQEAAPEAFKGQTYISGIEIPASVSQIGVSLCEDCTGLLVVDLSATVKSIPARAFKNCSSLVNVVSHAALTEIGEEAFMSASSLQRLICKANKPWNIGEKAFMNCRSLTGIGLRRDQLDLRFVGSIGIGAFCYCASVENFTLREKCRAFKSRQVGSYVFASCINLVKCTLPGRFTIGQGAFLLCRNLKNIGLTLKTNTWNTTIGEGAFQGCENLPEIFIQNLKGMWPEAYPDDTRKVKTDASVILTEIT